MKISPITYNNRNFKQLYVSYESVNRSLNNSINKLVQILYCRTNAVDNLDKHNIDVYIYAGKRNSDVAKIVFADKQGSVYKLPNGKYHESTRNIRGEERNEEFSLFGVSNAANVLLCVDKLLFSEEPHEKSADCNEAKEIKEVFSEKNKKFIYPFPVFK